MEYSIKKQKFIDATKEYIEKVNPLLDINKKVSIGNIRFTMYQIMIIQKWHKDSVSLDSQGNLTYPKETKRKRKTYGT